LSLGFYRNVYLPDNFIDYHKADVTLRIPKGGYYAYEVIRFRVDDFSPYGLPENANRHTTIPMNSEHISVKLSIKGGGDSEAHQTRFSEGRLYRALNTLAVVKQPKNLEFVPRVRKENTDFGLVRYINPAVDLDRYEWPLPDDEVYVLEGDVNHLYFICKEWNDQKHTCHTEVNLGPRVIAKIVFNFDNLKGWKRIVTNVYAKLREWNQSYNLPVAISE
jgi:hypothetical protein